MRIWTVGHSTWNIDAFMEILRAHGIRALVDVRRYPVSRRYPQFNESELSRSLADAGIRYISLPDLGGRRQPKADSRNTGLRVTGFRGYADYMETKQFEEAVQRLIHIATDQPTAIMCAEALWWRCHRMLIADFLQAKGYQVIHILGQKETEPHRFTAGALRTTGGVTYAASQNEFDFGNNDA